MDSLSAAIVNLVEVRKVLEGKRRRARYFAQTGDEREFTGALTNVNCAIDDIEEARQAARQAAFDAALEASDGGMVQGQQWEAEEDSQAEAPLSDVQSGCVEVDQRVVAHLIPTADGQGPEVVLTLAPSTRELVLRIVLP